MGGVAGHATAEATSGFAGRAIDRHQLPPEHFRLAPDGLRLSSIGLGTYLGRPDAVTDRAVEFAARLACESGRVNVIDTAINYRHQRAERSVGRALAALHDSGKVDRVSIFVATKVGYLAPDGESSSSPSEWIRTNLVEPGVLDPSDVVDGSHAMTPVYLTDQVSRSRANLGLETIDLVYLHNAADAQLPSLGPEEFKRRLRAAFETMERLRAEGALRYYGLATWDAFRGDPHDPGHLSLEAVVRTAASVGGADHGFRFIQFPFNLAMPEAAIRPNQTVGGRLVPLLDAAAELGIGCFTSVPLLQGELTRTGPHYGSLSRTASAIQFARSAPGNLAALIGQKEPTHLSENLAVASLPPWDRATFQRHLRSDRSLGR